jgi:hypothetical protein
MRRRAAECRAYDELDSRPCFLLIRSVRAHQCWLVTAGAPIWAIRPCGGGDGDYPFRLDESSFGVETSSSQGSNDHQVRRLRADYGGS